MGLVTSVRDYINRMLQDISGMKVLILDPETVSNVSIVYSQSELLQKEVFLVEMIDSISASNESMSHLKAVYLVRPTSENVQKLRYQLANPRFGEYHLFFSNLLKDTQIHILADSDEHEVVQQVQEFYADFVAGDPYHFTLNMASNHLYMLPAVVDPSGLQRYSDRVVDGIAAVFLALKRRPVIRYQRTSDTAKRIAQETAKLMYQQESGLFDFRRTESSPLLLVIDRRDDPVTPLLNQWTYQAMVHELIGLQDNKVDLRAIGSLPKDQQVEVVLSSEQDAFFKSNMYENFGDIGMNIKRMVDDFQQVAKSNQNIQTVEDMARFVDNYPEYKKMQGNVSKHVTLVTEMSKLVEARKLMLVSQTEQDLACNGGQGAAYEAVTDLLNNESVSDIDRLRLVMLYALRYEKENPVQLMQLFNKLASRSPKYKQGLVQFLLKQAGVEKRTGDLFGNRDLLNIARNMARGLKGVENVYTQHQPLLFQTMESITRGRLRDVDYPFVGDHFQQGRPQEVVIFMVGGTTYEESRCVALQNSTNSGIRFILGGTAVLNSKRFLMDLEEAQRISRSGSHMV
ncbi:Vacuolar protein sorting-associated protein 45-like protein [Raphanus sativus]|uniref:Vacuolar protein sorting-associated protein 45 homolog n=1 Tax=Raphanus sativus TaxID=3726 RepID=A0A6J0KFH5_RAPSA|nr:vacuolar protein sorting-associated protein 45 homolog [Raphanus sativus]KAJ4909183.1 Vacuolar protein sorting-associated protein 45-like protein [Raphanus sativus]